MGGVLDMMLNVSSIAIMGARRRLVTFGQAEQSAFRVGLAQAVGASADAVAITTSAASPAAGASPPPPPLGQQRRQQRRTRTLLQAPQGSGGGTAAPPSLVSSVPPPLSPAAAGASSAAAGAAAGGNGTLIVGFSIVTADVSWTTTNLKVRRGERTECYEALLFHDSFLLPPVLRNRDG